MSLKEQLSTAYSRAYEAITSARGREVGLFLLFLAVSYVFWLLLTLNHEVQEDVEVPISIVNVPDSVTFISDVPSAVKVSVRDKGSVLIRHQMGGVKVMKLDWNDYASTNSKFMMGKVDLGARLRDYFGPSSQIVTVVPDSIRINYTTDPGRRVPACDKRPAYDRCRFSHFVCPQRSADGHEFGGDDSYSPVESRRHFTDNCKDRPDTRSEDYPG